MSTTKTNRANIQAVIDGVMNGKVMETFETWYADNVVMSENGAVDESRNGKAANRAYEQYFVDNAEWFGARVDAVLADGDTTAYEMWMDLSFQGQRMQRTQFAVQRWADGQIVKETFYYKG